MAWGLGLLGRCEWQPARNGPSAERRGEATCVRRVFAADRACTPRESSSLTHGGDALRVPTHGLFASSNSLGGDGDGGGGGGEGGGGSGGAGDAQVARQPTRSLYPHRP